MRPIVDNPSMDFETQHRLYVRFPQIFAGHVLPNNVSAMGRGIETGDGWLTLIDALCTQLQWETDHNGAAQVVATQVKEKFGTLRFRAREFSDRQRAIVSLAEEMSGRICELCGAPGSRADIRGVRKTRCTAHAGSLDPTSTDSAE